jgi:hypothetical protein
MAYKVAGRAATLRLSTQFQDLAILCRSSLGPVMIEMKAMIILPISVAITIDDFDTPDAVYLDASIGCSPNCSANKLQ